MSEQTATERLRELLDERGVEWDVFSVSNTEYTHWTNNDGRWCAASIGGPLSLHVNILSATPEEAIAATLGDGEGSRDEWRSVALGLFDSLEKADLEEAKRWICDNDLLGEEIAYGDADAATLGSGTCTLPETRVDHGSIEYNGVTEWRKCSSCGEEILAYPAHYCPNCGAKVVD